MGVENLGVRPRNLKAQKLSIIGVSYDDSATYERISSKRKENKLLTTKGLLNVYLSELGELWPRNGRNNTWLMFTLCKFHLLLSREFTTSHGGYWTRVSQTATSSEVTLKMYATNLRKSWRRRPEAACFRLRRNLSANYFGAKRATVKRTRCSAIAERPRCRVH